MDGTVNCWSNFSGIRCQSIGFFYHEFQTLRWGIDGIPNGIRQNNVALCRRNNKLMQNSGAINFSPIWVNCKKKVVILGN